MRNPLIVLLGAMDEERVKSLKKRMKIDLFYSASVQYEEKINETQEKAEMCSKSFLQYFLKVQYELHMFICVS